MIFCASELIKFLIEIARRPSIFQTMSTKTQDNECGFELVKDFKLSYVCWDLKSFKAEDRNFEKENRKILMKILARLRNSQNDVAISCRTVESLRREKARLNLVCLQCN